MYACNMNMYNMYCEQECTVLNIHWCGSIPLSIPWCCHSNHHHTFKLYISHCVMTMRGIRVLVTIDRLNTSKRPSTNWSNNTFNRWLLPITRAITWVLTIVRVRVSSNHLQMRKIIHTVECRAEALMSTCHGWNTLSNTQRTHRNTVLQNVRNLCPCWSLDKAASSPWLEIVPTHNITPL